MNRYFLFYLIFNWVLVEVDGQCFFKRNGEYLNLTYTSPSEVEKLVAYIPEELSFTSNDNINWNASFSFPNINLDSLIFSPYLIASHEGDESYPECYYIGSKIKKFKEVNKLRGNVDSVELKSKYLHEKRKLFYYLPPGHSLIETYPVVYMTDGSQALIESRAKALEYKIQNGDLPKLILVSVEPGKYTGPKDENYDIKYSNRSLEYLKNIDIMIGEANFNTKRFYDHQNFFVNEVIPWAVENLKASSRWENVVFEGSSNGGSFILSTALDFPKIAGKVIIQSPGFNIYTIKQLTYPIKSILNFISLQVH